MTVFHWRREDQLRWIDEKQQDDIMRYAIRSELKPDAAKTIETVMSRYPWLSAGVAASFAQTGTVVGPLSDTVAKLNMDEKAANKDWYEIGDKA